MGWVLGEPEQGVMHPTRAMPNLNAEGFRGSCQAKTGSRSNGRGVGGSSMPEKLEQEHGSAGGEKSRRPEVMSFGCGLRWDRMWLHVYKS